MKRAVPSLIRVVVVLLALRLTAQAQQRAKIPRIGFVFNTFPADFASRIAVFRGGLQELGYEELYSWRRAAVFVDKILKGTKPADVPVEQPKKFELVINLKTAKQIGVTIPQWTLMKAIQVIK